ncbi:MAG: TolC family protein [Bacteroidaceae bacterium]|nr:TolC family protein [Bacteroidaceae bacterium]
MKRINIILLAAVLFLLSGCCLFGKYASDVTAPDNLFGNEDMIGTVDAGSSLGELSWRELFTDPELQELIDTALVRNADLVAAGLRVRQAEASLQSARLGYLPSLSLSPSIYITPDQGYTLPLSGSWGVDGFGSITNRKREAEVLALQAADYEQTVRSQLIASVAKAYYQLELITRQKEIVTEAAEIWTKVVDTQRALMENGKSYSAAVLQMEANMTSISIAQTELDNSIRDIESALCLLLMQTPQPIRCGTFMNTRYRLPESVSVGIPALILENRADVRAAGRSVEAAYYVTNQARAALFPSLSISGLIGWGTDGMPVSNPADLVYNALASLTQPVFMQGRLRANLKIQKLRQQEAASVYAQTILKAGNEVGAALRACSLAEEKDVLYKQKVSALENAYSATQELMKSAKSTYIEVLIAQESLLESQLDEAANLYDGMAGLIDLYIALGGGVR